MNTTARIKQLASGVVVRQLRSRVRKLVAHYDLTIIAVTGTVGKTSTKLAIGQTLSAAGHKVAFSEDSYNTEFGLPLALFSLKAPESLTSPRAWRKVFAQMDEQLEKYPNTIAVVEIAEDERALMLPWLEMLKPRLSVLTAITPAHMARFENLEQLRDDAVVLVAQAETTCYNADDDLVREALERRKGAHGFGLQHGQIRFENIARGTAGLLHAELVIAKQRLQVNTQLVAEHSLSALLAAASVAHQLKVPTAEIAAALTTVQPVRGRMRLLPAINGARLIDDTYNSSPAAVTAALQTLQQLPAKSRIAVLGSMNELGSHSPDLHRQVAREAAAAGLDLLVTVGKDAANYLAPEAIEAGMDKLAVKQFKTPYEAGHFLKKHIVEGDLVLVKGSQNGVFTEETSRILLAPGQHPADTLVRQSKSWSRIKKKSFGI